MVKNRKSGKYLITGAAGFIGSHLAKRLLSEGRRVILVDDFSRGDRRNLSDLAILNECQDIDLSNYDEFRKIIKGINTVFHMAARVGSLDYLHGSNAAELTTLQTNLIIDANVFKACLESNVTKIIYASSISVYPIETQRHFNAVFSEDNIQPISPEGGYGWAKFIAEVELSWMQNIDVGIARIFNIYGENVALGETAQVIPALISKAICYPKEDYIVWGSGEQTRDFLYVADCVKALLRLEEKASNPPVIVNIGSGKAIPIKIVAEKIAQLSGKGMKVIYDETRPVGPFSRTADISRARSLLGWEPQTSLDEGLAHTYSWVKRRLESKLNA